MPMPLTVTKINRQKEKPFAFPAKVISIKLRAEKKGNMDDIMEDLAYFGVLENIGDSFNSDSDEQCGSGLSNLLRTIVKDEIEPDHEAGFKTYGNRSSSFGSLYSMSDQEQEEEEQGDCFVENLNNGSKRVKAKEENLNNGSKRVKAKEENLNNGSKRVKAKEVEISGEEEDCFVENLNNGSQRVKAKEVEILGEEEDGFVENLNNGSKRVKAKEVEISGEEEDCFVENLNNGSQRVKAKEVEISGEEEDGFVENLNNGSKRVKAKEVEISGVSPRKGKSKLRKNVKEVSKNLKGKVRENEGVSSRVKTVRKNGKGRAIPNEKKNNAVDEVEVKEEVEDSVDETIAEHLNNLHMCAKKKLDKKMVYEDKSDHGSMHRNDDGSLSDVEILDFDRVPFCEDTPFVSSKRYESLLGEDNSDGRRNSSQSQFREKLMNHLRLPFDGKELDNLWREVTCKKPVQGIKDLRGGRMKLYATKINGKSYLEWFDDLSKEIDKVRPDEHKTLYLLRGFFFWLQNTAHEDAFKPWLDQTCLSALNGPEFLR